MTIYIIITTALSIGFLKDFLQEYSGGMWGHGKKKYTIGLMGFVYMVCFVLFNLIYGGIFWW